MIQFYNDAKNNIILLRIIKLADEGSFEKGEWFILQDR